MKDLTKRDWEPLYDKNTGKFFTGYPGSVLWYDKYQIGDKHEIRELHLWPVDNHRGRSAAQFIFQDKDGYKYLMSVSGVLHLLKEISEGRVAKDWKFGGFKDEFIQVKNGQNYFIEVI